MMIISPKKVEVAYQALCDLGVSLADVGHRWTNKQRTAWEKAERNLSPYVTPNARVQVCATIGASPGTTCWAAVSIPGNSL